MVDVFARGSISMCSPTRKPYGKEKHHLGLLIDDVLMPPCYEFFLFSNPIIPTAVGKNDGSGIHRIGVMIGGIYGV